MVVHDWGGPIGLRLAVEHPERFERLVILDTGLFTGHQKMTDAWTAFRDFVERTEDLPVGMLVRGACKNDPGDEVIAAYEAPYPSVASKAGARAFPLMIPREPDAPGAEAGQRVLDALKDDKRPTLMLWADSDPVLPLATGERFAAAIGREKPRVIENASHFLQEDAGPEIGRQIAEWLRLMIASPRARGHRFANQLHRSARTVCQLGFSGAGAERRLGRAKRAVHSRGARSRRRRRAPGPPSAHVPCPPRAAAAATRRACWCAWPTSAPTLPRARFATPRRSRRPLLSAAGTFMPRASPRPPAQFGVDDERHHVADVDVGPHQAQLAAHRLGEPDDRVLGRRVGGAARRPELAGLGGDVDDVAAIARHHPLQRKLRAQDHPVKVDVDHALAR